jgi:molybdopterin synthase sulfur carrier subunit
MTMTTADAMQLREEEIPMSITVALPGALLPYAGGSSEVVLEARCRTVGDALGALAERHAGVVDRVMDERGEVRQHVNVFVDGDNIRWLEGLATPVDERSTIVIVPSVSGG